MAGTERSLSSGDGLLWDSLRLGSGTALGQIILVLSAPVLARVFQADVFGTYALFNTIVITFAIVSGLRYDLAILLPEKEEDGFDLLKLQLGLNLVLSVSLGLLIYLLRGPISAALNDPRLPPYLWVTGAGIFLFGGFNGLNFWNTRRERYKVLAGARVVFNAVTILYQLGGALLIGTFPGILIGGLLIGKCAENGLHFREIVCRDWVRYRRPGLWQNIRRLAGVYAKFPKYNTWASLINTLSWQVPSIVLAVFFNTNVVGYYMMGERVVRIPMNFLGRAIGQVFFQKGSLAHRTGDLTHIFHQTIQMLTHIGLVPSLILTLAGRDLFIFILGERWAEAGVFVQILAPWAFIWFVSSPLSMIINIAQKQEKALLFNIIILISRLFSLLLGSFYHSARLALLLFSLSGILVYGWVLLWSGQVVGIPVKRTLELLFSVDRIWIFSPVICLVILKLAGMSPFLVFVVFSLFGCAYFVSISKKILPLLKSHKAATLR